MMIEISESELQKRKSNAAVFICRSCKDNKNKIVMVAYKTNVTHGIYYQFCDECLTLMDECLPCKARPLPKPQP